jgi:hypothetical protein
MPSCAQVLEGRETGTPFAEISRPHFRLSIPGLIGLRRLADARVLASPCFEGVLSKPARK